MLTGTKSFSVWATFADSHLLVSQSRWVWIVRHTKAEFRTWLCFSLFNDLQMNWMFKIFYLGIRTISSFDVYEKANFRTSAGLLLLFASQLWMFWNECFTVANLDQLEKTDFSSHRLFHVISSNEACDWFPPPPLHPSTGSISGGVYRCLIYNMTRCQGAIFPDTPGFNSAFGWCSPRDTLLSPG